MIPWTGLKPGNGDAWLGCDFGVSFSYGDVEKRIPTTHPLRLIRVIVNEVLAVLDSDFEALYEGKGRQSIAPERLPPDLAAASFLFRSLRAPVDGADQ